MLRVQSLTTAATLLVLLVTFYVDARQHWVDVAPTQVQSHDPAPAEPAPAPATHRPDVQQVISAFPDLVQRPPLVAPPPAAQQPQVVTYGGATYADWRTRLLHETQPAQRLAAVNALATLGANGQAGEATRDLLAILQTMPEMTTATADEIALSAALQTGLQRIGPPAVPQLLVVLQDPAAADVCRQAAAESLASTGFNAREWVASLLPVLKAGDHRTQQLARTALRGRAPVPAELVAALADQLDRSDAPVRGEILDLFREMGTDTRRVTSTVLRQLALPEASVRERAILALEASGFFTACQEGEPGDYGVTAAALHDPQLLPGYRSALELARRQAVQETTAVAVLKLLGELGQIAADSAAQIQELSGSPVSEPLRAAARETLDDIQRR